MSSWADTIRQVEARAAGRCEYCRMHQSLQGASFHVEHVVPNARGGGSDLANLAIACPGCNLHKSDLVEAVDPDSGLSVPLFNPRTDSWADHFQFQGHRVAGLTPTGRAPVTRLPMNHSPRLRIRQAEELFGLFHPDPERRHPFPPCRPRRTIAAAPHPASSSQAGSGTGVNPVSVTAP